MAFEFNNPLLYELRSGNPDSPYIQKIDSCLIVNNKIVLSELPSEFEGVVIAGYNESKTSKDIISTSFYVDYLNGIVDFNSSENGKTVSPQYFGRGIIRIPAQRVYATDKNGNPITDFQEIAVNLEDETTRKNNEQIRILSEDIRVQSEDIRLNNESIRQNIESIRQSNETTRETNEISRQSTFNTSITDVNLAKNNAISATNNAISATLNSNTEIGKVSSAVISTKMIWKEPVATYASIASTYPSPSVGWTTKALDNGKRYRHDGVSWVYIDEFSLNEVTQNTANIGDLSTLETVDKSTLVNSINEIKNEVQQDSYYDLGIEIQHDLDDYPIALIIGKNTFGHGGFGEFTSDVEYQIINKLEYLSNNSIRLHLSEEYVGIPTVMKILEKQYRVTFLSEDEGLKVILK